MMMREKRDYDDEREKGLWWWERKGIMMMREKRDYDESEKRYYDDEREKRLWWYINHIQIPH